jgi:hypothetical protein
MVLITAANERIIIVARLFVVSRLFLVSKPVGDALCLTQASREVPRKAVLTLTTRRQPRPRYLTAKNQPPLPAA